MVQTGYICCTDNQTFVASIARQIVPLMDIGTSRLQWHASWILFSRTFIWGEGRKCETSTTDTFDHNHREMRTHFTMQIANAELKLS